MGAWWRRRPWPRVTAYPTSALRARALTLMAQVNTLAQRIEALEANRSEISTPPTSVPQTRERITKMIAQVDNEKCTLCGLCVDLCPTQAITMNDFVKIAPEKCTGCGTCVSECPSEAISMVTAPPPHP